MNIKIKKPYEISKMRIAGKLAANVLEIIKSHVKPGISTGEIDDLCNGYIRKQKAISASLGYLGFPKSVCISINDVVCHGIPNYKEKLKYGDILNIDVAIFKDGFYSDTSKMFIVGSTSLLGQKLCKLTKESLYLAINQVKPGVRLRNIGKTIQEFIEKENFSVVRDYCGHGIGRKLHEDPYVLHYDAYDEGIILKPGMTFTIEPMINAGSSKVKLMQDGWTVKTKDNSLSAQYEHTILVTQTGCEIMTMRSNEVLPKYLKNVN